MKKMRYQVFDVVFKFFFSSSKAAVFYVFVHFFISLLSLLSLFHPCFLLSSQSTALALSASSLDSTTDCCCRDAPPPALKVSPSPPTPREASCLALATSSARVESPSGQPEISEISAATRAMVSASRTKGAAGGGGGAGAGGAGGRGC